MAVRRRRRTIAGARGTVAGAAAGRPPLQSAAARPILADATLGGLPSENPGDLRTTRAGLRYICLDEAEGTMTGD
jgi:hypothetical protein